MKIIDFAKKGNVVKFFLGKDDLDNWYGDDWDDTPYEYNAGEVYEEFVSGTKEVSYPYDYLVLEPCDGEFNSPWCKDDMRERRVPCIIVVPPEVANGYWDTDNFKAFVGSDKVKRYYFGDPEESIHAFLSLEDEK